MRHHRRLRPVALAAAAGLLEDPGDDVRQWCIDVVFFDQLREVLEILRVQRQKLPQEYTYQCLHYKQVLVLLQAQCH